MSAAEVMRRLAKAAQTGDTDAYWSSWTQARRRPPKRGAARSQVAWRSHERSRYDQSPRLIFARLNSLGLVWPLTGCRFPPETTSTLTYRAQTWSSRVRHLLAPTSWASSSIGRPDDGRRRGERGAEGGDRRACGGGLITQVRR